MSGKDEKPSNFGPTGFRASSLAAQTSYRFGASDEQQERCYRNCRAHEEEDALGSIVALD